LPIEGQIDDGPVVDNGTLAGGVGFHNDLRGGDLYLLAGRAEFKPDINAGALVYTFALFGMGDVAGGIGSG